LTRHSNKEHLIRLAIVEDHPVVLAGLSSHLKKEAGIKVIIEAKDGIDLFKELVDKEIDVVLLDLEMPLMNGYQAMNKLNRDYSKIGVIIFSIHEDDDVVYELLSQGAKGYLSKSASFDEIIDAVFNVKFKGFHSNEIVSKAIQKLRYQGKKEKLLLDEREEKVLELICDGLLSNEIADRIPCSKKLVDLIRSRIMKKLEVTNIASLVRKSILNGFYIPKTDEQIMSEKQQEDVEREIRRKNRLRRKG
jgi:DNA-binding NarL/FixJ family response regulator